MSNGYSKRGTPSHFSEESRKMILERISNGEFSTVREIMDEFSVSESSARLWCQKAGFRPRVSLREIGDSPAVTTEVSMKERDMASDELREKWKATPFVEPDPGVDSFRNEKDALEYYKLRAAYLENLYMLADRPTEVKKKALRQLEERIRERMAKGGS